MKKYLLLLVILSFTRCQAQTHLRGQVLQLDTSSGGFIIQKWMPIDKPPPFPHDNTVVLYGDSTWRSVSGSDPLPDSTEHSGEFLQTLDGQLRWSDVSGIFPDTAGHSSDYLRGDLSWQTVSGGGTWEMVEPIGVRNDTNMVFTLPHTPIAGTEAQYKNGLHQSPFSTYGAADYSISGNTITYVIPPSPTDILIAHYQY